MAPKLEYQPIFGMEQVTPSEAARNWTSLRLHNNCRLVRGDFNLLETGGNSNPGRLSLVCIGRHQQSVGVPQLELTQSLASVVVFVAWPKAFRSLCCTKNVCRVTNTNTFISRNYTKVKK